MMYAIGLTGGIGSGKSTIARIIQQMGYPIYIADTEASRLINTSSEIRNEMIRVFGNSIYHSTGTLNKSLLADLIFKKPQALKQVNQIVHPRVIRDFQNWCTQQSKALVFFESAILFEAHLNHYFDSIICVTAPESTRLQRVLVRDVTNSVKVKERMQNQLNDDEKCKQSDFVIYNDHNHMVIQQVLDILHILTKKINHDLK